MCDAGPDLIPLAGPWITEREVEYAADAARNGWYAAAGDYPRRFEAALADAIGVRHAIALPHCTAGIHLSLAALGVGPGDEVIVPDATWIATAAPITYVGATTVFADICADTWCLDAGSLEAAITEKTRAVIAVDLYGGMPDYDAIRAVTERHGIDLIEDAAEAIGSEYRGSPAGSFGVTGVFSFHGSKTIVTGEGGALVTDRDDIRDRVLFLRDHGRTPGDCSFRNTEIAFKYRMSALQAAVGLAQLERIEEIVARKREVFGWYAEAMDGFDGVTLNAEPAGTKNSYWMVTAIVDPRFGIDTCALRDRLGERGIDTRPFFHALSSIPAYEHCASTRGAERRNPVSHRIPPNGINLPSALCLTREQVTQVCDALKEILNATAPRSMIA